MNQTEIEILQLEELRRLKPTSIDIHFKLAESYRKSNRLAESLAAYRKQLEITPNNHVVMIGLAQVLLRLGKYAEADDTATAAMGAAPNKPGLPLNFGAALAMEGYTDQALVLYRRARAMKPASASVHTNIGQALMSQGNWPAAIQAFEESLALGAPPNETLRLLGLAWYYNGDLARACSLLDKAGAETTSHPRSTLSKSEILLAAGQLQEGWRLFEHRLDSRRRPAPPPYWNGEDISEKTIFVWPEWTLGDHVVFGSLLPDLIARAGRVILECKPSLTKIFARSFPTIEIMGQKEDRQLVEPPAGVDYQIPLCSLGRFLRPNLDSFPKHSGYLKSDPEKVAEIRRRYEALAKGRRIVGLGWRSKNEKIFGPIKCAKLVDWESVLRVPGIFFVNLLTGDWSSEVKDAADKLGVDVYRDEEIVSAAENVFTHAAAMDLIISTSNTVIHAAGSQNIPGWLILPRGTASFWYWFEDREDSLLYPSVRIFRTPRGHIGEDWWKNAIARAAQELQDGPS